MLLRDELRDATRVEHSSLESALAFSGDGLGRHRYVAYLRGWLAFCRSTEHDFGAGRASWEFAADCSARIAWLEDDLEYLAPSETMPTMPNRMLALDTLPRLAGASYVIEGSMLGAQVLYRQLHGLWRIEQHKGASFLWGYGSRNADQWRRFVAGLNGLSLTEPERQRCAVAARSTFRLLEQCFLAQRGLAA